MQLPEDLYTAAQVRQLDRLAIDAHRIPGETLMRRAGTAVFNLLQSRWPRACRPAVICGTGNNGGDGYVVARLALLAGLDAVVYTVGDPNTLKGDAAKARQQSRSAGVPEKKIHVGALADHDVIVDALLGIGLERAVEGAWQKAIEAVNQSRLPVLAVDVPSGLHADNGSVLGAAVRANATLTFIGLKSGLFTGAGREQAGEIFFDDLRVPQDIYREVSASVRRLTESTFRGLLSKRRRDLHKGEAGRVLVVGGDRGMPGAVRLAGEAAYRAGAGLVVVATHPDHASWISSARPELIVHGVSAPDELRSLITSADVIAIGPGLGHGDWGHALLGAVLDSKRPLILDADALNFLAADPLMHDDWILTPHPGEAARMLGLPTDQIQADRFAAVRELTASFGGVCVLKGSGTLIASLYDGTISVCDRGNPGMASGGMGDVLTGVIAGLRAQGLKPSDAARFGVWLHAVAGDDAAAEGEIGIVASDLLLPLKRRLNRLVGHVVR